MKYLLLIYNCERPEPGDPDFEHALARVNAFADECRRRGVFVTGDPLTNDDAATMVERGLPGAPGPHAGGTHPRVRRLRARGGL